MELARQRAIETEEAINVSTANIEIGKVALDGFVLLDRPEGNYEFERDILKDRIIGQDEAIDAVIDAFDRSDVRLDNDNRPIATLAFLGPTGVGKSQTAKEIANVFGKDKNNLIVVDCSSFANRHQTLSLTGSPPSYVGYDIKPVFNKDAIEREGVVVLFDEIEKGSNDLNNTLLQIMGDGRIKLGDNTEVSFRNTIIVITSNLGANEMAKEVSGRTVGFTSASRHEASRGELNEIATRKFKEAFLPEFINRLTKMVVFHPLSDEDLGKVLDSKIEAYNDYYEYKFGVRVSISERTRQYLIDLAAEERHMGARPLVRAIERNIQTEFGRYSSKSGIERGTDLRAFHVDELGLSEDQRKQYDSNIVFAARPDMRPRKGPEVKPTFDIDLSVLRAISLEDPRTSKSAMPEFMYPDHLDTKR